MMTLPNVAVARLNPLPFSWCFVVMIPSPYSTLIHMAIAAPELQESGSVKQTSVWIPRSSHCLLEASNLTLLFSLSWKIKCLMFECSMCNTKRLYNIYTYTNNNMGYTTPIQAVSNEYCLELTA